MQKKKIKVSSFYLCESLKSNAQNTLYQMTKYVLTPQYYLKKMTSMYCQMVLIFLNKGIYDNSCPTKKLALLYHLLQKMISHTLRNVSILNVMFNCILRGINRCEQKYTLRALLFIYGHLHVCIGFSLIVGWDS